MRTKIKLPHKIDDTLFHIFYYINIKKIKKSPHIHCESSEIKPSTKIFVVNACSYLYTFASGKLVRCARSLISLYPYFVVKTYCKSLGYLCHPWAGACK
jgi:hypothetical protein